MALQVYDTLRGRKEPFEPQRPNEVSIYVCGPTVYDMAHIGHARAYVAFDTIVRYLRRRYPKVLYVRNFTDVDDKIIKRAAERGESPLALSERYIATFLEDMDALGVRRADIEPKVTEHIGEIVALIEQLVASGAGYAAGGDVYYAVQRFATYGKLGKRTLEDMEAGARVDVGEHKRHPMDFALWKGAKPGEPMWPSPWGEGRPGWHIECSAMSMKYLGQTFDIHGGGRDLIFPHHENEIAQSEAATKTTFARYWLHNGFVNVDNEKMSKSLGNFFTIREVLDRFDAQALRYYLLTTHYRSPINFSDGGLREAEARVKYLYETLARLGEAVRPGAVDGPWREEWVGSIATRFDEAMNDDFNTAKALGDLSEAFRLANEILAQSARDERDERTLRMIDEQLRVVGAVLGMFEEPATTVLARLSRRRQAEVGVDAQAIEILIGERTAARKSRNFARADAIRDELLAKGIVLRDGPQGTTWEVG